MKKLIFAINTSLDGCCDHAGFTPDEEMLDYFTQLTLNSDTFVYGRKTYQLMVPFWPDAAKNPAEQTRIDYKFALAYDAGPKIVVFSKSLGTPDETKTSIVRTGLREEIIKLKQGHGKNIMTGGVDIPSQLASLGLIDEYHLVVHPIVIGNGIRLFQGIDLQGNLKLRLAESRVLKSGAVVLRYEKN